MNPPASSPATAPRQALRRPVRRRTAGLFGIGVGVPERVVTNDDIAARLDTSDEWIVRRTGIRERRLLRPSDSLAELRDHRIAGRARRRRL